MRKPREIFAPEHYIGRKFGHLTVVDFGRDKFSPARVRVAICECDCGSKKRVLLNNLLQGKVTKCRKWGRHRNLNLDSYHPLYRRWNAMLKHCNDPLGAAYKYYGGRGIKVCREWQTFSNFVKDMFPSYKKRMYLVRREHEGDFSPSNCYWDKTTHNRFSNTKLTAAQLSKRTGYSVERIRQLTVAVPGCTSSKRNLIWLIAGVEFYNGVKKFIYSPEAVDFLLNRKKWSH